jgi:hypothetical protein
MAEGELIRGLDVLALAKTDLGLVARFSPDQGALGVLEGTFGNAVPAADEMLKTGKFVAFRAHLLNCTCVRAHTCERNEPFGRGKLLGKNISKGWNRLIGGWEISGIYNYAMGAPINLPTNTAFFKGGDPGRDFKRTDSQWFDTSFFAPFPQRNTTVEQLRSYPSWTGVQNLPGYDWAPTSATDQTRNGVYQDFRTWVSNNPVRFASARNPADFELALGLRKNVQLTETVRLQLRMDVFNALNRPQFANINTDPRSPFFGVLGGSTIPAQVNSPRALQLVVKLYF